MIFDYHSLYIHHQLLTVVKARIAATATAPCSFCSIHCLKSFTTCAVTCSVLILPKESTTEPFYRLFRRWILPWSLTSTKVFEPASATAIDAFFRRQNWAFPAAPQKHVFLIKSGQDNPRKSHAWWMRSCRSGGGLSSSFSSSRYVLYDHHQTIFLSHPTKGVLHSRER